MKKVIYSKYSNDRNENFKIRTDILADENGNRYVCKKAVSEKGRTHIQRMGECYQELVHLFEDTRFKANRAEVSEDGVWLEYVEGITLEQLLDSYLFAKDYHSFQKVIENYAAEIRKLATEAFEVTEEYLKVFGTDAECQGKTMPVTDVDLIFGNVIVRGEEWTVLDYEWTFEMPIPVEYVLFRALHYYETPVRNELLSGKMDLYDLFGIDKNKSSKYKQMEEHFQEYLICNNEPLWKLCQTIGKPRCSLNNMIREEYLRRTQVLRDYGEGFVNVSEYISAPADDNGDVILEFEVDSTIKTIRIDPAECKCVVELFELKGFGKQEYEIQYETNGTTVDHKVICFDTQDPQIWIRDFRDGVKKIRIKYNIGYPNDYMIAKYKDFLTREQTRHGMSRRLKKTVHSISKRIRGL